MKRGRLNEKGFTLSEILLVFAIALLIGLSMLPFIQNTRKKLVRTQCANNLSQIGLGLYIYAREHDGKFPPTLKTLYDEQYLADMTLLDCPASKNIGTFDSPDYLYAAGLSVKDPSLYPLVEDKEGNHSGRGGNVMYINGTVTWQ
ncbi:MAG: type II secretion system protein [Candidatus Omnitrophica bacterium]|nr:type II secretion system protein [Candidatus Omnitrophota bacterium]